MRNSSALNSTRATWLALLAATVGIAAAGCGTAATVAAPAALSAPAQLLGERLATFDYVWSEIRDKYYDKSYNGVNWDAVREKYRPLVTGAGSDADFYKLLRSMTGELKDAHTRVLTPQQARDREAKQTTSAGVILFEVEGQPVVFDVRPGSPAAEAGLRPGMLVLSVNGIPVAHALDEARREVGPSSSEQAAKVLAYLRLVAGTADETLRLGLKGATGPREVELPRRPSDSTPHFESRRLPSGHLYVRFDRFREPVASLFKAALEQSRNAPGLILDLRANTGGDGKEGMRTIAPLLNQPTLVTRLQTRTGKAPSALMGLVKLPLEFVAGEEGRQVYAGPIIVLTNDGTGSTSEVIAASLQERGRARVAGSRSCGCVLGVLRHRKLKGGGALAVSEVGLVTGLGRRLEGTGVTPDIPTTLTLADLESGRDRVLETAISHLSAPAR